METSVEYDDCHPKCPKCGCIKFELVPLKLSNSGYSLWIVKCWNKDCEAVIGIVPGEDLRYHAKHS
jgi:hypothetical protein